MIYADENVWQPVADGLRRRGWEVTTTLDEDTLGYSDSEHLRYAAEHDWILLTFDDDFLSLVESKPDPPSHSGIVFISQHRRDVGEIVRRVDTALERHDGYDFSGEIIYA
jgi:predicted nuclease of predicted toxin-antitoxin system